MGARHGPKAQAAQNPKTKWVSVILAFFREEDYSILVTVVGE